MSAGCCSQRRMSHTQNCVQVLGNPGARKLESECQRHLGCGWGTYFGESILLLARLQLEQRYLKMLPQVLISTRPVNALLDSASQDRATSMLAREFVSAAMSVI